MNRLKQPVCAGGCKYSEIRHLASAIFPFSDKIKYMLMLNAYFDETGKENDPGSKIVGIGGCVAPFTHWERFEPEWTGVLGKYGVGYMHMKEFSHSVKGFDNGWKGDRPKREAFQHDLWDVIDKVNPLYIGCFLPMSEYRVILTATERQQLYDAFFIAYSSCVAAIQMHVFLHDNTIDSVSMIFDENKGFKGVAFGMYDRVMEIGNGRFLDKIPSPVFRDMRKILPLQVADMVAYECGQEFARRLYTPEFRPRLGFQRIQNSIDQKFGEPVEIGHHEMPLIFHPPEHIESIARGLRNLKENPRQTPNEEFERFQDFAMKLDSIPKKLEI